MPIKVIEGSLNYCLENKAFFLFVLFLLFILKLIPIYADGYVETFASVIICVIIMGYGLQVTEDIIRGGTRLPKIMPKKVIILGLYGVGKTTIINKLMKKDTSKECTPTINVDIKTFHVKVNDKIKFSKR